MATLMEDADVEALLAYIHLEKYLESFRQSGVCWAKDFIHLDQEALSQLGVTATGHRKRILKLAEQIQQTAWLRAREPSLDRCQSESAIHLASPPVEGTLTSPVPGDQSPPELLRNNSVPNIPSTLLGANVESSDDVVKPVPKPRTVFTKLKMESPLSPLGLEPHIPREPSLESLCFVTLEGSPVSEKPSTPEAPGLGYKRGSFDGPLLNCASAPDSGGLLPPVPPRMNRGVPPATFRGRLSPVGMDQEPPPTPPRSSSPGSPRYRVESPSHHPVLSPVSLSGGLEMVSNEIYCGASPSSTMHRDGVLWNRHVPLPPPRQDSPGGSSEGKG